MQIESGRPANVVVTGSLAFDLIMDYPGDFKDHILPDKAHVISISFLVGDLKKQRGGCAGNIAYTLALLNERPVVVAAAGNDFADYATFLVSKGVDVSGIRVFEDEVTPSCHITTDKADNQITGFHMGAMHRANELEVAPFLTESVRYCIVSPDHPGAMLNHCREARSRGFKVFFDPSFQVTAMGGEDLLQGTSGCYALVLNDYEWAVFQEKTGLDTATLLEQHVELLIVTLGEKGSEIFTRDGRHLTIPTARPEDVVDPTGAGDAYRGGFVAGLLRGLDLETCGRMGSVASAYAIERYGTQQHSYTQAEFAARYEASFGASLALVGS